MLFRSRILVRTWPKRLEPASPPSSVGFVWTLRSNRVRFRTRVLIKRSSLRGGQNWYVSRTATTGVCAKGARVALIGQFFFLAQILDNKKSPAISGHTEAAGTPLPSGPTTRPPCQGQSSNGLLKRLDLAQRCFRTSVIRADWDQSIGVRGQAAPPKSSVFLPQTSSGASARWRAAGCMDGSFGCHRSLPVSFRAWISANQMKSKDRLRREDH